MRIQNKLLLVTLALVVLLIFITGCLFAHYGETSGIEQLTGQMQALAETLSLQLESRIQQMDLALLFMLSDPDFLSSISYYTMPGRDVDANKLLVSNSGGVINRVIKSYAIHKTIYRATLFTSFGDYFSSHFQSPAPSKAAVLETIASLSWTEEAQSRQGRMLLLTPYSDPWSQEHCYVYGVARALRTTSGATCYLEIQNKMDEITTMLNSPGLSGAYAGIYAQDGSVFYVPEDAVPVQNSLLAVSPVNAYGLSVRVWQSREAALAMLRPHRLQVAALCAVALFVSAAYLYFASRRITKPIRIIRHMMERTALETLDTSQIPSGGDELKALSRAFNDLCLRLKAAVAAQMQAQQRETRALMDALQAQVDPHFLFNTLNVIAGRAMVIGDDEIVSTCDEIASMLRYSADTRQKTATIRTEAAHFTTYLALMKKRYRSKLNYHIDLAEALLEEPMPKIVLQQFAENAIRHGFSGAGETLTIQLTGRKAGGVWTIEISDDGAGFSPDVLKRLTRKLRASCQPGAPCAAEGGLSIGGMGILNTYARLRAFYGQKFRMTLFNGKNGGAHIRLSAPCKEDFDARNDRRR